MPWEDRPCLTDTRTVRKTDSGGNIIIQSEWRYQNVSYYFVFCFQESKRNNQGIWQVLLLVSLLPGYFPWRGVISQLRILVCHLHLCRSLCFIQIYQDKASSFVKSALTHHVYILLTVYMLYSVVLKRNYKRTIIIHHHWKLISGGQRPVQVRLTTEHIKLQGNKSWKRRNKRKPILSIMANLRINF